MTDGMAISTDDGALWITLDRPERLNALTAEMADRLAEELEQAAARDDVHVVVLRGTGPAFSAGADLSGEDAHEHFDVTSLDRANRIIRAITGSPKPCVAAVNGVAAGVGCSAALACDLVVAAGSASFMLGFSRIGLMPDGGATATVAASVGRARAMRMALLGEALTAEEAYDVGLVSHLAPDEELDATVSRVVRAVSPRGLRWPTPPPRRRSTPPPSTVSRTPSNASAAGRPSFCAPPTSPRACARSQRSAARSSGASDPLPVSRLGTTRSG